MMCAAEKRRDPNVSDDEIMLGRWSCARIRLPNLALPTAGLCLALSVAHQFQAHATTAWMVGVTGLAFATAKARYSPSAQAAVRLWQLLAVLSAIYGFAHYPLMPVQDGSGARLAYALLLAVWLLAIASGFLCFRVPSFSVIPPAYLVWSALYAGKVTGLYHGNVLDIVPLAEVSLCLGLGLTIDHIMTRWRPSGSASENLKSTAFPMVVLWLAIAIHLANYFWSAVAKFELPGPLFAWVRYNNPAYIYLAALDDRHIFFGGIPAIAGTLVNALNKTHFVCNLIVFVALFAALFGLLLPRRAFLMLLTIFDVMHISIALAAGANFWPWVLLNVAIAVIISTKSYAQPGIGMGLLCALFMIISPGLAEIAYLGWYDTGANNNMSLQAEDKAGHRYYVPANYFTFYSYPMGHMDYGTPAPEGAFAIGHPNGGAYTFDMMRAGLRCDVPTLVHQQGKKAPPAPDFSRFVLNYMGMAEQIRRTVGVFPYAVYPHHFYEPWSVEREFDALDKSQIVAYVYHRDSVCLSLSNGSPHRRLISSGELRIEASHD